MALRRVVLPFGVLRARLIARPQDDLGRLPADRCWRVIFAYVERLRSLRDHDVLDVVRYFGFAMVRTCVSFFVSVLLEFFSLGTSAAFFIAGV